MANASDAKSEFHQTKGALDILTILREEFEQWVEEAEDDSKHEALDNVLGHVASLESEYKRRLASLQN